MTLFHHIILKPSILWCQALLRKRGWCTLLASITFSVSLFGQSEITITQPELKFADDRLCIQYEMLGTGPDDLYNVQLEVTDTTGKEIIARSLYGDIGDSISGASPKQIIWDLAADSIYVNIGLAIEIFVTKIAPPKPVLAERQDTILLPVKTDSVLLAKKETGMERNEDIRGTNESDVAANEAVDVAQDTTLPVSLTDSALFAKNDLITDDKGSDVSGFKSVKTGSNLLLSTVVPGWGLTRLSEGHPYWLLGVAAYGCLGSSIYLNHRSFSNYSKYLESSDVSEWEGYFDTGHIQYNASKILAWSAFAIWVGDLGLTWIKAAMMKHKAAGGGQLSVTIKPSFRSDTNTPVMTVNFVF